MWSLAIFLMLYMGKGTGKGTHGGGSVSECGLMRQHETWHLDQMTFQIHSALRDLVKGMYQCLQRLNLNVWRHPRQLMHAEPAGKHALKAIVQKARSCA